MIPSISAPVQDPESDTIASSGTNSNPANTDTDTDADFNFEGGDPFINILWGIHSKLDELRGSMSNHKMTKSFSDNAGHDFVDASHQPTYIVIQVTTKAPKVTLRWLIEKLTGPKTDGGGELIVMKQPFNTADNCVLHISATQMKLLEIAEEIELLKKDQNGKKREFMVSQMEDFFGDALDVDNFLSEAEKQNIVRHRLENIRALSSDTDGIPGYPSCKLYEGQSILQACQHWGIVTKVYPLHDKEKLKRLGTEWYMSIFGSLPLESIRLYFGESIALYFKFLDFYTRALIVPVVLGFLQLLLSAETVPFFCFFNVVWVTLVLEVWKRRSNEAAFIWDTIEMTSMDDDPRPNFRGAMGIDAITGKVQPQSPRYMTYFKMYVVSLPLVIVCMMVAFFVMLLSFWAEDYIKQSDEYYQQYIMAPSIIYSIIVCIMNVYYRMFATYLTEWENHRTQSQFERHRVTKLILFEFVNNFVALFYIAFVMQDIENLRSQLQTMLIISQAINTFQEVVQPLATNYYALKIKKSKFAFGFSRNAPKVFKNDAFVEEMNVLHDIQLPQLQPDDERVKQAFEEGEMEIYEGTYDDYLELFIQFGFVFLFSSVYPIAAFWALLNNVAEIRADALKLCKVYQRPLCRKVKDIGAWQRAFEILSVLSILTNCGIMYLTGVKEVGSGTSEAALHWFVFVGYPMLGIRYLLHIAISDKPEWVRVALARRLHERKQAAMHRVLRYKPLNAKPQNTTSSYPRHSE